MAIHKPSLMFANLYIRLWWLVVFFYASIVSALVKYFFIMRKTTDSTTVVTFSNKVCSICKLPCFPLKKRRANEENRSRLKMGKAWKLSSSLKTLFEYRVSLSRDTVAQYKEGYMAILILIEKARQDRKKVETIFTFSKKIYIY